MSHIPEEDNMPDEELEQACEEAREWPINTPSDCHELLKRVQAIWRWPDYFRYENGAFHVSTGGWSDHEALISALQQNHVFWMLCWQSSRRGGHYVFEVRR